MFIDMKSKGEKVITINTDYIVSISPRRGADTEEFPYKVKMANGDYWHVTEGYAKWIRALVASEPSQGDTQVD